MEFKWSEQTLFPVETSVSFEIVLGIHQESQRIGLWIRGAKRPTGRQIFEEVSWHNFTDNGVCSVVESLWHAIHETEEHHGLQIEEKVVDRISAPF